MHKGCIRGSCLSGGRRNPEPIFRCVRPCTPPFFGRRAALGWRIIRGDQGHLMLREHIIPQSEVIRAMFLEHSPCCGVPAPGSFSPASCSVMFVGPTSSSSGSSSTGSPSLPPRTRPACRHVVTRGHTLSARAARARRRKMDRRGDGCQCDWKRQHLCFLRIGFFRIGRRKPG